MSNEDDYFEAGKLAGFQKGAAHERRAIVAWLRRVKRASSGCCTTRPDSPATRHPTWRLPLTRASICEGTECADRGDDE